MKAIWLVIRPLGLMAVAIVLTLSLSRVALITMWWPRVESAQALGFVVSQGLRFDLVLVGIALIPPLLLMVLMTSVSALLSVWKTLLSIYVPLVVMCVLFMELSTPNFAEQFDARPNILFFEYFEYPKEVLSTLWGAYRAQVLIGVLLVLVIGYGFFHLG